MSENNDAQTGLNARDDERNKRYDIKDAVGKRHTFIAGQDGVTEEWIAFLRHDENEMFSSNYHYYFRWNGREYVPAVMRSDLVDPEELEHYPSMTDPGQDAETILIEREDREAFLLKFYAAMHSLTESQVQLVRKRYVQGLSDAPKGGCAGSAATAFTAPAQKGLFPADQH